MTVTVRSAFAIKSVHPELIVRQCVHQSGVDTKKPDIDSYEFESERSRTDQLDSQISIGEY